MSQPSDPVQKKGIINKCPSCGAQIGAFVSSCESCGHEFTEIEANRTITALVSRFDEIEREVEGKGLGNKGRQQAILEKRARVIRDFPIPNSREDLQQLIYFIQPKVMDTIKPDPNIEDWKAKFTEVLNRAKNAYKNNSSAVEEFERIEQSLNTTLSENLQIKAKRNPLFVALLSGIVVLALIGFVNSQMEKAKLQQCEEKYMQGAQEEKARLDKIFSSVDQDYKNKKYSEALATANQIRWDYAESECKVEENQKAISSWNEKRTQMTALIQKGVYTDAADKQAEVAHLSAEKQAEADRLAAETQEESQKAENVARLVAEKEKARAAIAATEVRKASTETQW